MNLKYLGKLIKNIISSNPTLILLGSEILFQEAKSDTLTLCLAAIEFRVSPGLTLYFFDTMKATNIMNKKLFIFYLDDEKIQRFKYLNSNK